jgi:hypothetical protein
VKRRTVLWALFALFFSGALLPLSEIPGWVSLCFGAGAWGLFQFLCADFLLNRWLRGQVGQTVTPVTFILQRLPLLLVLVGISSGLYLGMIPFRLDLPEAGTWIFGGLTALCGMAAFLGGVGILRGKIRCKSDPFSQLNERLEPLGLKKSLLESLFFFRTCFFRLLPAFLQAGAFYFVLFGALLCLAYGIIYLGIMWRGVPLGWNPTQWPGFFNLSIFFSVFALVYCFSSGMISSLFFVQKLRKDGRLLKKGTWTDVSRASERVEIIATLGFSLVILLVFSAIIFLSAGATVVVNKIDFGVPFIGIITFSLVSLFLSWVIIFYPLSYMLLVLSYRDCGWMMALEAATELMRIDGVRGVLRVLVVTLLFCSVLGIPMALCLLDTTMDRRLLLLLGLLKEKTWKEVDDAMNGEERERPTALDKFYQALDKGRYLDGLNGFQIYLIKNPLDVNALRGECFAYLRIGNPRSRESLERWASLEPDNPDPTLLLEELEQGLWSEHGQKFLQAQEKCTQKIGRGI